jgi:hypothetical protein
MLGTSFSISLNTNTITTFTGGSCNPGVPTSYAGSSPVSYTSGLVGSCASGALKGMSWTGPSPPVPLAPGQQLTFVVVNGVSGASGATANLITSGDTYQVTVLGSGQSVIQNVVSQ